MSGRGAPLGDKILTEIRSLMALFLRNLRHHRIDLALACPVSASQLAFPCKTASWNVGVSSPRLLDPLSALNPQTLQVQSGPLLPRRLMLRFIPCQWELAMSYETVFSPDTLPWHLITFEKINQTRVLGGTVGKTLEPVPKTLPVHAVSVPHPAKMKTSQIPVPPVPSLKTQMKPLKPLRLRTAVVPSRLSVLPFTKAPLPLHRFSGDTKRQFREALAEKARTNPANIQIHRIYDRIHLEIYDSMTQDTRGQLVCFPKPQVMSRRSTTTPMRCFYLVFGQRLDTQEAVKALIPMHIPAFGGDADGS